MKRAMLLSATVMMFAVVAFAQSNAASQTSAAPATQTSPTPQAAPRCDTAEHRQFDFWVGEWDIVPVNPGRTKPTSSVHNILNGCVIFENYTNGPYSGKSFNTYDRVTKKWRQIWVDIGGAWIEFEGGMKNGMLVLESDQTTPQGRQMGKMEYTPNADGTVRQVWTTSADGGKNWTTAFDGTYHRKK